MEHKKTQNIVEELMKKSQDYSNQLQKLEQIRKQITKFMMKYKK